MMSSLRFIEIEKIANSIRPNCVCGTDYGISNVFESAEQLGYKLIRYPLGENDILGSAERRGNDKIIFSNSSVILAREIFTVAHEIGHHELHLSDDCILIKDPDFLERDIREIEANYFSACLLMPEEQAKSFVRLELENKPADKWTALDIAKIQTVFNVSFDMALARLNRISILPQPTVDVLKSEKSQTSVTTLLKIINGSTDLCHPSLAKKVPAEFLEWVLYNYQEKLIPKKTLEKALQYFDSSITDVLIDDDNDSLPDDDLDALIGGLDG